MIQLDSANIVVLILQEMTVLQLPAFQWETRILLLVMSMAPKMIII